MNRTKKTTGGFIGVVLLGAAGIMWLPDTAPKYNGVVEYVEQDGSIGKDTFLDLTLSECTARIKDGANNIGLDGGAVTSSECVAVK